MYNSYHCDKQKMLDWEKPPTAIKTNYDSTEDYFEALLKATGTHHQYACGNTSNQNKHKLANNLLDYGNIIQDYIAKIATVAQDNNGNNNSEFEAIVTQIKALTDAVAKLSATKKGDKNTNPKVRADKGSHKSRCPKATKLCNMDIYCRSHGFYPVGTNHTSTKCNWKKINHNSEATWSNWLGGDIYWPTAKHAALKQQDHTTWKGKSTLTN